MASKAHGTQSTTEIVPFHFFVPIAKVDKETREVTGIVTQEILDKQGDIVDYAAAKKFFQDDELWPGNMREMHKPEAVGKKVRCEFDDANKTIILTSRVSKGAPNTWEKVLDETLSFYSIGGNGERVTEKLAGGGTAKRLFLKQLAEVSFVDNGACPTAKFEIVKSVDGKLVDAEPEEPVLEPIDKAVAVLDAALAPAAAEPVAYVAGSVRKLIAVLAMAGTDRVAQKAAIVTEAQAAGPDAIAELPFAWQPETVRKGAPEPYDIDNALTAISVLERLMANEYYDARYGAPAGTTPDPVKVAQIGMLKAALDAVLQFLVSEHQAQFAPDPSDLNPIVLVDDDDVVEMFAKSLDVLQKAGARHSKKDQEMVQKVHDVSKALGADCPPDEGDEAEKAAKAAACKTCKGAGTIREGKVTCPDCTTAEKAVVPVPESTDDVKKIAAELDATKTALSESQANVAKQAETLAALADRLQTLEVSPAGGGPVKSAAGVVEKTLGTEPGGEGATPASIVKALQELAAESESSVIKDACAKKILKYQFQTGSHQLAFAPAK